MKLGKCICCGKDGKFTIALASGPQGSRNIHLPRYYIPNEHVRESIGTSMDPTEEVPFCGACMRVVEDNMRATILYLQADNGLLMVGEAPPEDHEDSP